VRVDLALESPEHVVADRGTQGIQVARPGSVKCGGGLELGLVARSRGRFDAGEDGTLELVERRGQGFCRAIVERRRHHGRRGHHANQRTAVLGDLVGGDRQDRDDTEGDRKPGGDPEPGCARDPPGQTAPRGRDRGPH
jgi:hypothetical protein